MKHLFGLRLIAITLSLALISPATASGAADDRAKGDDAADVCRSAGQWIDLPERDRISIENILERFDRNRIILLGETHDNAEHHRWQLHTLAALHGRGHSLVIGLEMFPGRAQPALEKWVRGDLSREAFLAETDWNGVWGFPSDLYMPIFDFARMHEIPMIALNVERGLIARVAREGWEAVPRDERQGVTTPVTASQDYQRSLAEVYALKEAMRTGDAAESTGSPPEAIDDRTLAEFQAKEDFQNFVAAQQVWDRAMAQRLADASIDRQDALIVGIVGSGHVEQGFGIPAQLRDLGVDASMSAIPVEIGERCNAAVNNYADAVFTVDSGFAAAPSRPRLGVRLRGGANGVGVASVGSGSVAEAAGIEDGDEILEAAGHEIDSAQKLVEVIARQAPGTWLPLKVKREQDVIDLVAKFPASTE